MAAEQSPIAMTGAISTLVLPIAFLSIFLRFRTEEDSPAACARTFVWFGAAILILTELLSVAHAVRPVPLTVAWALTALGAQFRRPPALASRSLFGRWEKLLLLCLIPVFGLIAVAAAVSPPNSTDAMGYHLPRVVYWAQAGSVAFFPVHYLQQLTQPPFAEYSVLLGYVLSGGDHLANFTQYFAFSGCTLMALLIARRLGAGVRGQALAAVCCATLPNGILQASGVKNDTVLALWIALAVYYGLAWAQEAKPRDAVALGITVALACATKGVAYLFLPPLLAAVLVLRPKRALAATGAIAIAVLVLDGPQYGRNISLSGRPLGPDSAQADGINRWMPDRIDAGTIFSNVLRVSSEHLAARSERWNNGVRDTVVEWHRRFGLDPNDPATTWRWEQYQAPRNANHEANAGNRWQLILLALALIPAILSRDRQKLLLYGGLLVGYLLFCACLRWQPFLIRMQLPLFVVGMALVGAAMERVLPLWLQVAVALVLLNGTKHYLLENWVRPLVGPHALYRMERDQNYFNDMTRYGNAEDYRKAAALTLASRCRDVGIDNSEFSLEYPYQALMLERDRRTRFIHTEVANASVRYPASPSFVPCAVLCLNCAGKQAKLKQYEAFGEPTTLGQFLLYLRP